MDTLFVAKDAVVERDDSTLIVKVGGVKRRFPVHSLRHVIIAGEARLTTAVLVLLARADVRVTVLDWHGNAAGFFESASSPSAGVVHLAQAKHVMEDDLRLELARTIVLGALRNLIANLAYRSYRGSEGVRPALEAMRGIQGKIQACGRIDELMGHEGAAKSWYFQAWRTLGPSLDFGARVRRPPNNRINCLISWFNGLCYSAMRHAIAQTHLDPVLSFLHSPRESRFSLALDITEVFKPALTDTLIMRLALRDEMQDAWFEETPGVCRLTETGRAETLRAWTEKFDMPSKDGKTFRSLMLAEALGIERHVLGMETYVPWHREV